LPPAFADLFDLGSQRVEILLGPVFMFQQCRYGVARRTAEKGTDQLVDGVALDDGPRFRRRVDIA
jgi:hypothetical protein